MTRRRRHVPPDLTSLFDVLFIVIFAALIRAAAVQQAAAQPKPAPPKPPPAVKLEPTVLHARALADLHDQLAGRPPVIVRISGKGTITAIETDGKSLALDTPLLEQSADPDVALAYLGDRSAEQRVCRIAALHVGAPDLARYLVIVAPADHLIDLPHALYDGLRRDVERCLYDQKGLAVIVDPSLEAQNAVTTPDRKLAKDVASELERRRRRRKLIIILIWAIAIAAAIFYMQCGRGWGLGGGKGKGAGTGSAVPGVTDAGPMRCTVRVTAKGITVDGKEMKNADAVAACAKTEGAMVTVTGDARQGDWDELRVALEAAGVKIYLRGEVGDFGSSGTGTGSAGSGSN